MPAEELHPDGQAQTKLGSRPSSAARNRPSEAGGVVTDQLPPLTAELYVAPLVVLVTRTPKLPSAPLKAPGEPMQMPVLKLTVALGSMYTLPEMF